MRFIVKDNIDVNKFSSNKLSEVNDFLLELPIVNGWTVEDKEDDIEVSASEILDAFNEGEYPEDLQFF